MSILDFLATSLDWIFLVELDVVLPQEVMLGIVPTAARSSVRADCELAILACGAW